MDLARKIGFDTAHARNLPVPRDIRERINLHLAALGEPTVGRLEDSPLLSVSHNLLNHVLARNAQQQHGLRPPVDRRIEAFIADYLGPDAGEQPIRLPGKTFHLLQHGVARALSLPADGDVFRSPIIESYRLVNGVLHNPASDRRTTQGVFHVAEGGLPIAHDKKAVPRATFAALLRAALKPPQALLHLPFTAEQDLQAHVWVSLLLRPVVCPAVPGLSPEKSMEIRFFAPGSMVCNLDFVESVFGNAGDPFLPENDAATDVHGWSGHTGCVILAPHLKALRKKDLGLPHIERASERQRRDGMCWSDPDELYNEGGAFKITARDASGVIITLIADNYFGYCKKEVKTQMSFAANLLGMVEEEHAGGTLAYASYDLGEVFQRPEEIACELPPLEQVAERLGGALLPRPEGYAVDALHGDVVYVPAQARFALDGQRISWFDTLGNEQGITLLAGKTYLYADGYSVRLVKPAEGRRWRLIGTVPEATHCHKPCTVSGGGKSEISKSIADAIIHGPCYVGDLARDLDAVEAILSRDFGQRFVDPARNRDNSRPILGPQRSLGSVIKLLTPSAEYTEEHNAYLRSIPTHIRELLLLLKRLYKDSWGKDWRGRFSVDIINGIPGHELKYRDSKVIASYLRLGYDAQGAWRVFSLRKDFYPAAKIQTEDDITASVVAPWSHVPGLAGRAQGGHSVKLVRNAEYRLFQRPDDAVIRGYDQKTESDFAREANFLSNYQPLDRAQVRSMVDDAVHFDHFSAPMQALLGAFAAGEGSPAYVGCTANPRLVNGAPSRNPRYLQVAPPLETPLAVYVAEMAARLKRGLDSAAPVVYPVNALLPGRRNNPPQDGVRPLAVHNPIHYLPLPEAFMEFISSMTGKSPSTTGAGSEGALTKAPFNALLPIHDLNNALLAAVLTGLETFVTAAGCVGPQFRVDHDVSLLVPEIWCRMRTFERKSAWLIEHGMLEPVPPCEHEGRTLPTGLLGYRINQRFVNHFLGRIFSSPEVLFTESMLRPELQDMAVFADGLDNMLQTHRQVAQNYFEDGSIELACPPLHALLHLMRDGHYQGMDLNHPQLRALFSADSLLRSEWYQQRLDAQQRADAGRAQRTLDYLAAQEHLPEGQLSALRSRAQAALAAAQGAAHREALLGTLGMEPALLGPWVSADGAGGSAA